tara:strand:+ start:128 stop:1144 length:1017 start_codon:yes stop_codon:yes gene_type:complete
MATQLLRSPQYISAISGSATASVKLTISIEGVIQYTLIKDAEIGVRALFEWGELARDYLDITYSGSYSTQPAFDIILVLNFWTLANAGGTQVGGDITNTHYGLDGYGTFYEGASPSVSATAFPAISNYSETIGGVKTYTMYAPKDVGLQIPSINAGTIIYNASGYNADSKVVEGVTINIERIDCTKYTNELSGYTETSTNGFKVSFINKYGAIQSEFFTLKAIQEIQAKKENYNSNTISSSGTYSINEHTKQNFNITGTQSITLNSFYLPEYYNQVFTEMLLSEKVWVRFRVPSTNDYTTIPVNIKTNNLIYKNSLNDRLIQFEFSFDMSFDYINSIR